MNLHLHSSKYQRSSGAAAWAACWEHPEAAAGQGRGRWPHSAWCGLRAYPSLHSQSLLLSFVSPLGTQPKRGPSQKAVHGVPPGGVKGLQDHPPPETLEAEPVSSLHNKLRSSIETHIYLELMSCNILQKQSRSALM